MKFEYLEVRPCIEVGTQVSSFIDMDEYAHALEYNKKRSADGTGFPFKTYWTLYGRYDEPTPNGKSQFLAMAIGDFSTKDDAHKVMNAILAPMAAARDLIDNNIEIESDCGAVVTGQERASALLTDFINQCSNMERI